VVKTDPSRTLDRLSQLRIAEKVVRETADPRRAHTSYYRIADNLLAFWRDRGSVPGRNRPRAREIGPLGPRLQPRYAVCARERLTNVPRDALALTAADIFRVRAG